MANRVGTGFRSDTTGSRSAIEGDGRPAPHSMAIRAVLGEVTPSGNAKIGQEYQ
jgi:hypothetical protein